MGFFLGFVAGFVSAVAISALIIIIGIRKIDKLHDELEELEKDDGK